MIMITQVKRDKISKSYVNFKDKGILVLEGVNGKAFETFKSILVKRNNPIENEEVVFFKDLTWFGGGEEGILISSKYFYYYQWGFKKIAITDIAELKIGGLFDESIVFVLKNGQSESIWAAKLFSEVKATIETLQANDEIEIEDNPVPVQVQCLGCKAIIRANQSFCDYCRSPRW